MTTPEHPPRQRRWQLRGDQGFTLLAAVATASVCLVLAATAVAVAISSNTGAGQDRDRRQAVAAAESAVDRVTVALGVLDGAAPASAWCSAALPSTRLTATSTYSATVTYWAAQADIGTPSLAVACGQGKASAVYAQVLGTGVARTGSGKPQTRRAVAVVKLPRGGALAAVATNDVAYMGDYVRATAPAGTPAIYAGEEGGRWICGAHSEVQGDVVVPRSLADLEDYCSVTGDVKAKTLYLHMYSKITGDVITQTTPTRETYSSIEGTVEKRAADSAWKATPLPAVDADVAVWQARGYALRQWVYGCTFSGDVSTGLTAKTVFDTRNACPDGLDYTAQDQDLVLGADMALIVNGFSTQRYFNAKSSGARRTLTVVRPRTSTDGCTDKENVQLADYSGRDSTANIVLQSGCHVSLHAYTKVTGQVQAEVLWWYNYSELAFAQVGWTSSGSGFGVVSRGGTS